MRCQCPVDIGLTSARWRQLDGVTSSFRRTRVLGHSLRNAPEFLYREGLERMAAVWQPLTNSPKSCLSVREKVLLIWDASYKNMGENGII